MPYDPEKWRQDLNEYHDQQRDRQRVANERANRSQLVTDSVRTGDSWLANWEYGIEPVGYGNSRKPSTPTDGEQFNTHIRRLHYYIDSLWKDSLPSQLLDDWRGRIATLDIEKPPESLTVAIELREGCLEAKVQYAPPVLEFSSGMRFVTEVNHIRDEIQWLIDILRRVIAFEAQLGNR